jgi:hypothetical protein
MTIADEHREVCETVYTFAEAMDSRDWARYRELFPPEIEIDYSFFHPDQKGRVSAGDWAANVSARLTRLDGTQHAMTNARTRVDGDQATCKVYAQAQHVVDIDQARAWCVVAGQYTFGLVRAHGTAPAVPWLVASVALQPHFIVGDERVLAVARA